MNTSELHALIAAHSDYSCVYSKLAGKARRDKNYTKARRFHDLSIWHNAEKDRYIDMLATLDKETTS